jgi:signal transduction histidine kinase
VSKNPVLHPLLVKQLKRANISIDALMQEQHPEWLELANHVSQAYHYNDQDRYLLERSLNISSREMSLINKQLEHTQQLARLGYWLYNTKTQQISWSNEMYYLTGLDPLKDIPNFNDYVEMIHKSYRDMFLKLIDVVEQTSTTQEIELQFKNKLAKDDVWHLIKIYPETDLNEDNECPMVSAIVLDITKQKNYEEDIHKAHRQMVEMSRQAGMSEVATSVLHNVGNILNSMIISLETLNHAASKNYPNKLSMVSQMIEDNREQLSIYLSEDEKGKLIPDYLAELAKIMSVEHAKNSNELHSINESLKHITEIISSQLIYAKPNQIVEEIDISQTIDMAVQMAIGTHQKHITLTRAYTNNVNIKTDKTKLLQILVNLIRNAYESVIKNEKSTPKKIMLSVKRVRNQLQIIVDDNGEGISKKNLKQIFNFGFTTKKKGHGFGLHSSAIAAKEIKGGLKVESQGVEKGASFILTLPLERKTCEGRQANE